MTYPVYNSNGVQVAEISDYSIDQTTSVSLIGFASMNYMEYISENFYHIMENFASPGNSDVNTIWAPTSSILSNPTVGQLWFHTYIPGPPSVVMNRLRYWDGDVWKSIASLQSIDTKPSPAQPGDLWYDTVNNQLMYYGPLDNPSENPSSPPTWININSSLRRNSPPANPAHGCFWWMLPEGQLYMYDSGSTGTQWPPGHLRADGTPVPNGWALIAPLSPTSDYSYLEAFNIGNNNNSCIKTYVQNRMVGIWSAFNTTPTSTIMDNYNDFTTFTFDNSGNIVSSPNIRAGLNLNNSMNLIINGTCTNTEYFNNFDSSRYFLKHLDNVPLNIDGSNSDNLRIIGDNNIRYSRIHSTSFYGGDSTTTTPDSSIETPPSQFGPILDNTLPIHLYGRAERAQYSDSSRLSIWSKQWQTPRFTSISGHVLGICDATNGYVDGSSDWSYNVSFSATGDSYIDSRADQRFKSNIAPYNARITNLETEVSKIETDLGILQNSSSGDTLNSRVTTLETEYNDLESKVTDLTTRVNNHDSRLNNDDSEIGNIQNQLTDQRTELDKHQKRLDDISNGDNGTSSNTSNVTIQSEGISLTTDASVVNFTGLGVKTTGSDTTVTVNIPGMPIGCVIDYAGTTSPATWFFCYGQAISRTSYPELFSAINTTYGAGDGVKTFNLPDFRGKVSVGKDNMGGSAAGIVTTISGITGTTLGSTGGEQSHLLTSNEMPTHQHNLMYKVTGETGVDTSNGQATSSLITTSGKSDNNYAANAGGGYAHNNMQPSIILNKIIFAGRN